MSTKIEKKYNLLVNGLSSLLASLQDEDESPKTSKSASKGAKKGLKQAVNDPKFYEKMRKDAQAKKVVTSASKGTANGDEKDIPKGAYDVRKTDKDNRMRLYAKDFSPKGFCFINGEKKRIGSDGKSRWLANSLECDPRTEIVLTREDGKTFSYIAEILEESDYASPKTTKKKGTMKKSASVRSNTRRQSSLTVKKGANDEIKTGATATASRKTVSKPASKGATKGTAKNVAGTSQEWKEGLAEFVKLAKTNKRNGHDRKAIVENCPYDDDDARRYLKGGAGTIRTGELKGQPFSQIKRFNQLATRAGFHGIEGLAKAGKALHAAMTAKK